VNGRQKIMEDNIQESIRVFISYAYEDQRLRERLEAHLALLQQQGLITMWHDRKIIAGTEWASEIDAQLHTAQIILLLVSAAFLASEYCNGIEMARILKRHESGQARVIPVILRPVDWRIAPLNKLQALPTGAEPVTGRRWRNIDEAFADVSRGIREVVQALKGQLVL
jgi:internalin A